MHDYTYEKNVYGSIPPGFTIEMNQTDDYNSLAWSWTDTGQDNCSIDMWLLSKPDGGPESIRGEIMVWLEQRGSIQPAGQMMETTPFGTLWQDSGFEKLDGWAIFTFVPTSPISRPLDLKAILDFLVRRQSVDPTLYLASVEFGNEIYYNGEAFAYPEGEIGRKPWSKFSTTDKLPRSIVNIDALILDLDYTHTPNKTVLNKLALTLAP